jgi:hypothetical protein
MLSLRAQRSNLVATQSLPPEIAMSPSAPRNDEFSFVLGRWDRRATDHGRTAGASMGMPRARSIR